jgi:uncharacterized membrane protein
MPEETTIPVDVSVDEAMKLILSGGILTPDAVLHPRPANSSPGSPFPEDSPQSAISNQ